MEFFQLFLPAVGMFLSAVSLIVFYWIIKGCKESAFIPTFYFIAFSLGTVFLLAVSRIVEVLTGSALFNYNLLQDLLVAYMALFLFGALWQNYETAICIPPKWMREDQ